MVCQVTLICWGGRGWVVAGCCTVAERLKEVFSTGGKWLGNRDPVAPCLPLNYHEGFAAWESFTYQMWDLSSHTIETFPHRFSSHPLVSPKLWGWFSGGLVSISSAALPHPALLRLMNISSSRSDSPPPALRSYSQTRSELSVPIDFRWWPCRCASEESGEHIALGGSGVCIHASYTQYHSLLEFKEGQASTQNVVVME